MKKLLLTLALLAVSCGPNPCDVEGMPREEQQDFINSFTNYVTFLEGGLLGNGVGQAIAILIVADRPTGDECFDFLADQAR